jgi:predicted dinucleotide-binding enzyme
VTTATIIGAGNMARGIATRLATTKIDLQILAPQAERADALARELSASGASVSGASVQEPMEGDVVILAVPYEAALEIADTRRDELTGKIVIDITNPVDAGPLRRARQLEQVGFLHMALQDKLGSGYGSAIKIITP